MFEKGTDFGFVCCQQRIFPGNCPENEFWAFNEKIVCLMLVVFTVGIAVSKVAYLLSEQGLYFGDLRIVYDWTKLCL